MKQLGNLAIVCARKKSVLLQIFEGTATVHVGRGPSKSSMSADWQDDDKINEIIHKLNFGKYAEKKGDQND